LSKKCGDRIDVAKPVHARRKLLLLIDLLDGVGNSRYTRAPNEALIPPPIIDLCMATRECWMAEKLSGQPPLKLLCPESSCSSNRLLLRTMKHKLHDVGEGREVECLPDLQFITEEGIVILA
jgi:hypothetical protein